MSIPDGSSCVVCNRSVHQRGRHHAIESARDQKGVEQFTQFLRALLASGNRLDKVRAYDLALRFHKYSHHGELKVPMQMNVLVTDRLSEFKAGDARAVFFAHVPSRCADIRVTHGFIKRTPRTPRHEIDKGLAIRREDERP